MRTKNTMAKPPSVRPDRPDIILDPIAGTVNFRRKINLRPVAVTDVEPKMETICQSLAEGP